MQRRQFGIGMGCAVALGSTLGPTSASFAQTQPWPQRPVRLILSQPPGNGVDAIARLVAEKLGRAWGQAVVIENKPGGQNTIGAQAAARSAPDGYTFYFATLAALITNRFLFKELSYDPEKDFVPAGFVGTSPFSILVPAASPIGSVGELIALCTANPGKVSFGIEGPRSFGGMVARVFAARSAIQPNLVAYASGSVAMQDALGGHIDVLVSDLASVAPLVRQGRLKLLATTSARRIPGWDSTPTLAELFPGFEMIGWFAVVAPTGTPAAIVDKFNAAMNQVLADPEVVAHIATIGPIAEAGYSPARTGAFFEEERKRWALLTREIGLLPE